MHRWNPGGTSPQRARAEPAALIVGAGPVGLSLAVQLQQLGVPHRIVELNPGPSTATKAMAIHSRTLELFRAMGVAEPVLAAGKRVRRFRVRSKGKTILLYDFELLDAAYPFLLSLPQPQTEALLLERLEALGGHVEWNVQVGDIAQAADGVTATLRHASGQSERAAARWLVGCDGARSTVRRALGLGFEGDSHRRHFMLADVDIAWTGSRDEGAFFLGAGEGYVGVAPLDDDGRYRLFVEIPRDLPADAPRPALDLAAFQRIVAERGQAMQLSNPGSMTAAPFQHRRVSRQQVGRVFLAGDAAHIGSPIGGQYMNMGIAEAHNLAWKLAYVHRGAARPELLDSYDTERQPLAVEIEETANALTRILTMRHPLLIRLRDTLFPLLGRIGAVRRKLPWMISGHRYRYRAEAARTKAAGVRVGALAPDLELWRLRGAPPRRLLDVVCAGDGRSTLLLFASGDQAAPLAGRMARIGRLIQERYPVVRAHVVLDELEVPDLGAPVEVLLDPDRRLHRRYGAAGGAMVLVRPDGFVAFAGTDVAMLLGCLDERLCLRRAVAREPRAPALAAVAAGMGGRS